MVYERDSYRYWLPAGLTKIEKYYNMIFDGRRQIPAIIDFF